MMRRRQFRARTLPLRQRRRDSGYAAVLVAFLIVILVGLTAFVADVGNWYLVGLQAQKAADAAALAGVVNLPDNKTAAFSTAQQYSARNGFANGVDTVVVAPSVPGQATQLQVTVTKTVRNGFAGIFGVPETTITRTALADFIAPIPMGSPCNEFGDDPETTNQRSTRCAGAGKFWLSIATAGADKQFGDAYASQYCSNTADLCTNNVNGEYDANGYFYQVETTRTISNLSFQVFDPMFVKVGDTCTGGGLNGSAGTRYAPGAGKYCTGDVLYGSSGSFDTRFRVRRAVSGSNPWDPTSYPVVCDVTYGSYQNSVPTSTITGNATLSANFRKWVQVCNIASAPAGRYFIQVSTTGTAQGQNRMALGAWSTTDTSAKDSIAVAGWKNMGIYANVPGGVTSFYLVRVPSAAAGQILNVRLFDIGDIGGGSGSINLLAPGGGYPTGCTGIGPVSGALTNCGLAVGSAFQGKWETIRVPIPATYTCVDTNPTDCWYRLQYTFTATTQPVDTTSWTAGLEGNPVRIIK